MIVRKMEGLSDEMSRQIVSAYIKGIQQGFYQDVAIWDNKVRIDNPLLCEGEALSTNCANGTANSTWIRPRSPRKSASAR